MTTNREAVHLIMDELKMVSDDNYFTTDHALFLLGKHRAAFLKRAYTAIGKEPPEAFYQRLCLGLEPTDRIPGLGCRGGMLRSTEPLPQMMPVGRRELYAPGYWDGHFALVSRQRMRHVGHDRWRRNVVYGAVAPDGRLYLTSANPAMLHLLSVELVAIFETPWEAEAWSCDGDAPCDPLDAPLRMEEAHIPLVVQSVVRELSMAAYRPADPANDSADALSAGAGRGQAAQTAQAARDDDREVVEQ